MGGGVEHKYLSMNYSLGTIDLRQNQATVLKVASNFKISKKKIDTAKID